MRVVGIVGGAGKPSSSSSSSLVATCPWLGVRRPGCCGWDDLADGLRDGGVVVVKEVIWLAGLGELVDVKVFLRSWLGLLFSGCTCNFEGG